MAKKDPRIDAYIDKAAPFARPVLNDSVEKECESEKDV